MVCARGVTRRSVSQAPNTRNAHLPAAEAPTTSAPLPMRALRLAVFLAVAAAPPVQAASGRNGMVAAEHRLAAEAGVRMLQPGRNAVDAALATALAVGLVNPSSCGIRCGGVLP